MSYQERLDFINLNKNYVKPLMPAKEKKEFDEFCNAQSAFEKTNQMFFLTSSTEILKNK